MLLAAHRLAHTLLTPEIATRCCVTQPSYEQGSLVKYVQPPARCSAGLECCMCVCVCVGRTHWSQVEACKRETSKKKVHVRVDEPGRHQVPLQAWPVHNPIHTAHAQPHAPHLQGPAGGALEPTTGSRVRTDDMTTYSCSKSKGKCAMYQTCNVWYKYRRFGTKRQVQWRW